MPGSRVTTIGGALLLLAGIYTLPSDLDSAASDVANAVAGNTIGAALVVIGASLVVGANWTSVRYWAGFGRGNQRWVSDIERWFRDNRGFVLKRREFVREWPGDRLLPRTGFVLQLAQQQTNDAGTLTERHVTFARDPGGSFIMISMGLRPSAEHAELLRAGAPEFREDLLEQLVIALGPANIQLTSKGEPDRLWAFQISWAVPVDSRLVELEFVEQVHAVLRAREVVNGMVSLSASRAARVLGRQLTLGDAEAVDDIDVDPSLERSP